MLDSNYPEGKTPADLLGHLSSQDFFDIANNPTATFNITSADSVSVTGTLNLRGTENEETVNDLSISEADGGYAITGTLVFDRKIYGAMFDMTVPDMVLSDDIALNISIKTKMI